MSRPRDRYGNVIFQSYSRLNDGLIQASDAILIGELKSTYVSANNKSTPGETTATFEKLIISTPNAGYLPLVNVGHQVISMCADGRWGAEDYAQWPQWYFDGQEHFPYIPCRPSSGELLAHPLRRLWWNMTEDDFQQEPGPGAGVGKLTQSIAQELYDIRSQLMKEVLSCTCNNGLAWSRLQMCAGKMRQCTSTLLYTPQPYFAVRMTLAAAQRYCLETRGCLDRIANLDKIHASEHYPPVNNTLLGCVTDRVPVVYEMYEKGIPVWFVRPLSHVSSSTNIVAQGDVLPPAHHGIEIKRWPGAPAFYQGILSREMHAAIENWRPGNLELNLLRNGDPEVPREVQTPSPEISKGKGNGAKPYSRTQAVAKVSSKKPNISINLELFEESNSPYMPNCLDVWKQALKAIHVDTARIIQHPDSHLFRGYAFPPAQMFCGEDETKSLENMLGWVAIRSSWIDVFGSAARTSVFAGPQQWRIYIRGVALGLELLRADNRQQAPSVPKAENATKSHSTRRGAKMKEQAKEIFDAVHIPPKETLTHIIFNGHVVWRRNELKFSMLDRRILVWDAIDHNFRLELSTLDRILVAKEWAKTETKFLREVKLNALWPNDLLLSTEVPSKVVGITVVDWKQRSPFVEAFRRILIDWPGDTPKLLSQLAFHKQIDGEDCWDETIMRKVETLAAGHYCQVFFDYFGRAPCIPCTFPVV